MLSSPEVIIEGDHDYGDDLMMDMACWLCNHLLPDIGYQIVITFRKFDDEDDGPAQGFHLGFDSAGFECVFASDNNKGCQEVFEKNFKTKLQHRKNVCRFKLQVWKKQRRKY